MTTKKVGRGNPPEHTRWKPGQSGNPAGRAKLPPELKAIRELNKEEMKRLFAKYARMDKRELNVAVNDPNTPMLELVIASGLVKAAKDGDYTRLNFILDRTIGKAVDKTELELPEPVIIRRRSGEEIRLEAQRRIEDDE